MPIQSIGDMSKQFLSLKSGGAIKSDLARLSNELSTGRVSDPTSHLGGDTRGLSGVNHSLKVLNSFNLVAKETSSLLDQMQLVTGKVESIRELTTSALLLVTENTQPQQIQRASEGAKAGMVDIVSTLNSTFAGRRTMGGADISTAPLASADAMISDIIAAIGGATNIVDIEQIVNDWFDDPAGGFATLGYQGDTGPPISKRIGPNQIFDIDVRADDVSVKNILKATALAAVVSELPSGISSADRGRLLQLAGTEMLASATDSVGLQSRLGALQEKVEIGLAQNVAERSQLSIAFNEFTSADPFETATQLEAVRVQLETHFAITGRLSRLSLVEYI